MVTEEQNEGRQGAKQVVVSMNFWSKLARLGLEEQGIAREDFYGISGVSFASGRFWPSVWL